MGAVVHPQSFEHDHASAVRPNGRTARQTAVGWPTVLRYGPRSSGVASIDQPYCVVRRHGGGRVKVTYGPGFALTKADSLLVLVNGQVTFNVPDRSPEAIRKQIVQLTKELLARSDKREFPVEHTLIDGVYTRKLFIPARSLLIGQIHLKECVNIVAKGDISILTETGLGRFQAGHVAVSGPGIQKVGYAHEDTVFVNVFRTDLTDINEIESEIARESVAEELLCQ
jgi:hypothetical protein